ncbi:MAG: glycosyltransferase family 2 protein [Thiomonas arsenitoxydans]|uniref:Glycosyltransferase family 2 protein n=1 Tax=Thiomonas arsenitoxydans (strain DSM 22701 / CIP 110005 / 3As) TaxID=426114 RepID=A0A8I1MU74_THIA3|nr:glycosyltransferase family 2 protein [Thiomonas arsenitoxydans]MBN8742681.1 glycosyltransferase family 2 protein [Thiomonas arsenitoxydans]
MSARDQDSAPQRVTVSVVSHGQRDLVAALLEQIAALRDPSLVLVVVVHNLPDADLPKPQGAVFDLVQLHNTRPLGFSANHNLAFRHCKTPWFAVLNPDIEFPFGNPFPALLEAMIDDDRLGAVAPALVQPGTLHIESNRGVVTPIELIRRRLPGYVPPAEPSWLVGAFLLVRSNAFCAVGGFDNRFNLYCEDVDFGLRIRARGWKIRRLDALQVVHLTQRWSHKSFRYTLTHIFSLMRLWSKIL